MQMELRFVCPKKNYSKDIKVLTLSNSTQIKHVNVFFFPIASLNDSFAHCFKYIRKHKQLMVSLLSWTCCKLHTYTHFADILTRLSNLRFKFLFFNLKKYNLMKQNLLRIIYLTKQFIQNSRCFCIIQKYFNEKLTTINFNSLNFNNHKL